MMMSLALSAPALRAPSGVLQPHGHCRRPRRHPRPTPFSPARASLEAAGQGAPSTSTESTPSTAAPGGEGGRPPPVTPRPAVLTIGCADPTAGAGAIADVKTILANGGDALCAVTSVSAGLSDGVHTVWPMEAEAIQVQVREALGRDPRSVKVGMPPNGDVLSAVTMALVGLDIGVPLVVDPVMLEIEGERLLDTDGVDNLREALLPRATVCTPSLRECAILLNREDPNELEGAGDLQAMVDAARELSAALGGTAVLLNGGRIPGGDGDFLATDVLVTGSMEQGGTLTTYTSPWLDTVTYGAGCALSSALAAHLARGRPLHEAASLAKDFVTGGLLSSMERGGSGGPDLAHTILLRPDSIVRKAPEDAPEPEGDTLGRPFRPSDCNIYMIASPSSTREERSLEAVVSAAIEGGATMVQLRDKQMGGGEMVALARRLLAITRAADVPLIINDRVDVALASGADGVHLGQTDLPVGTARQILGPGKIVGVSVHSPAEAEAAMEAGVDYLGCGSVFPPATHKDAFEVIGLQGLRDVCARAAEWPSDSPVVAVGGLCTSNAGAAFQAGADGVAVCSAIVESPKPRAAAEELAATRLKVAGTVLQADADASSDEEEEA